MYVAGFRLAMVQMAVGAVKKANLQRATSLVAEATKNGAKMVILPVNTCCCYVICSHST